VAISDTETEQPRGQRRAAGRSPIWADERAEFGDYADPRSRRVIAMLAWQIARRISFRGARVAGKLGFELLDLERSDIGGDPSAHGEVDLVSPPVPGRSIAANVPVGLEAVEDACERRPLKPEPRPDRPRRDSRFTANAGEDDSLRGVKPVDPRCRLELAHQCVIGPVHRRNDLVSSGSRPTSDLVAPAVVVHAPMMAVVASLPISA
jgi:hypothetical protein